MLKAKHVQASRVPTCGVVCACMQQDDAAFWRRAEVLQHALQANANVRSRIMLHVYHLTQSQHFKALLNCTRVSMCARFLQHRMPADLGLCMGR